MIKTLIDSYDSSLLELEIIFDTYLASNYPFDGEKVCIDPATKEQLKAAQERLDELVNMDQETIVETAHDYNISLEVGLSHEEQLRNENIEAILQELEDIQEWLEFNNHDTTTLNIIDDLAAHLDKLYIPPITEGVLPHLTSEEWHNQAIKAAHEHLQRTIDKYQKEVKQVEELNAAIGTIREYFKDAQ